MPEKPNHDLLARAAEETMRRIRGDRRRAPKKLWPLIAYIEKHLFEPAFDVNALKKACGVRNNNIMMELRDALGDPAALYITLRRTDVAAKLLRDTRLTVKRIASLVGYTDQRTFSRAFHRISGELPSTYRERLQQEAGSAPTGRDLRSRETWRLAHNGKLPIYDAVALIEHFQRIYGVETSTPVLKVPIDGPTFERFTARQVWAALKDQPLVVQLSMVRSQTKFTTPALFDLLRAKSREVGREDRQRSVLLAELALASLEGGVEAFGDSIADLKAQGWAWLGNARRLALDFEGSEDALARAEAAWATARPTGNAVVKGEIHFYRACLRLYQRRLEEAMELDNRAISLFRAEDAELLLAQALIIRAKINGYSGDPNLCIHDLEEAIGVLADRDEPFVLLSAYMNMATASILLEKYDRAAEVLPKASRLCAIVDSRLVRHQLQWIEALQRAGEGEIKAAETLLKTARSGFLAIREPDYAAVAAVDLATIYKRQNRHREAMALVSKARPVCDRLNIRAEAAEPGYLPGRTWPSLLPRHTATPSHRGRKACALPDDDSAPDTKL